MAIGDVAAKVGISTAGASSPLSVTPSLNGGAAAPSNASSPISTTFGNVSNSNGLGFWTFVLLTVAGGVWLWKSMSK